MNVAMRRALTTNAWSRRIYCAARQKYHLRQTERAAKRYFLNADAFKSALAGRGGSEPFDVHTLDGLTLTMRPNYGDAMTIAEIFLDDCYAHDLNLPPNPLVIDIGGFIGDFSLYAVKRLGARKVIVCEPSPRNWTLLLKNIANNGFEDRIVALNKAVTADGREAMMNIDAPDDQQCMVSAYCPSEQNLSIVLGISLSQIFKNYALECVDLVKIDVEGGEYAILESTPSEVLCRIRNIVFEYHDISGGWGKLSSAMQCLRNEGFVLHTHRGLVTASRP